MKTSQFIPVIIAEWRSVEVANLISYVGFIDRLKLMARASFSN